MSLRLSALYHWSPAECRELIERRGLRPTCPTAVWIRPDRPGEIRGHTTVDLPEDSLLAVCLGTTPSTAWALSGAWSAARGDTWDLWEVELADTDEVHYRPNFGDVLDEVRVANRIPMSRCWLVGSRTRGTRRWYVERA